MYWWILRLGKVPYCGELRDNITKSGVNKTLISAVPVNTIKGAISYAINPRSWNPVKAKQTIESDQEKIKKTSKKNLNPSLTKIIDTLKINIKIERERINHWETLSNEDKNLIENPFSVIYGIRYTGEVKTIYSDYACEVGIPKVISLVDLIVYVPNKKINLTKNFVQNKSEVTDFETLYNELNASDYWPSDNKRIFEILLKKTK